MTQSVVLQHITIILNCGTCLAACWCLRKQFGLPWPEGR